MNAVGHPRVQVQRFLIVHHVRARKNKRREELLEIAPIQIEREAVGVQIGREPVLIVVDEEIALLRLPNAQLRGAGSERNLAGREVGRIEHANEAVIEVHVVGRSRLGHLQVVPDVLNRPVGLRELLQPALLVNHSVDAHKILDPPEPVVVPNADLEVVVAIDVFREQFDVTEVRILLVVAYIGRHSDGAPRRQPRAQDVVVVADTRYAQITARRGARAPIHRARRARPCAHASRVEVV